MKLLPIKQTLEENEEFVNNPICNETLSMSVDYYKKIGFNPPWICYYVLENEEIIGNAAYKGKPVNNSVEIAYGTMESHRKKGLGTQICKELLDLAIATDPEVRITARTLPEKNYSTRILEKNGFILLGTINDPDDGEVWEWEHKK